MSNSGAHLVPHLRRDGRAIPCSLAPQRLRGEKLGERFLNCAPEGRAPSQTLW